jgi:hypothetical protein
VDANIHLEHRLENLDGTFLGLAQGRTGYANRKQIYGTMNGLAFIMTLFLPETKGLSLEEMDILFRVVDESTRRRDIEEHIIGGAMPDQSSSNDSEKKETASS